MNACPKCQGERIQPGLQRTSRKLFGRTFASQLSGSRCLDCGETYVDAMELLRFELGIAAHIAEHGPLSGESLSWMRRALGYTGEQLAAMLNVRPETLSRWEHGKRDVDRNAWLTTAALVSDEVEGKAGTRERIEALSRPPRMKRVTLDLSRVPVGLPSSLGLD